MLAVSFGMSSNEFPYASLLERVDAYSSKQSQERKTQQQHHRQHAPQFENVAMSSTGDWKSVGATAEWKPEHFPHKMYDLLEDVERKGLSDIVSWLPDGKSFKIHSQSAFEETIMPRYFSGMSSYKSFRRQLNLYGIYQHRHRPNQDANAYSHEYLIRGQRHLCDNIVRKKSNPPSKPKTGDSSLNSRSNTETMSTTASLKGKKRNRTSLNTMIDEQNKLVTSSQLALQVDGADSHIISLPSSSNRSSNTAVRRSPASADDVVHRSNMTMRAIVNDEFSTRPNPVNIDSIDRQGRVNKKAGYNIRGNNDASNMLEAFMDQYWGDLPTHMSSSQVVDEIIATFRQKRR